MPSSPLLYDLAARQRERAALAAQRAATKLEHLPSNDAARALILASQRARTVSQRVVWLQRAASAWAQPMEAVAACRKGCAHCCHIPVTISRVEAQLISAATGRASAKPKRTVRLADLKDAQDAAAAQEQLQHRSQPLLACPFLQDGVCSIYAQRPIACRALVNLDDDDLLCRHAPAYEADVPYADSRVIRALALAAQSASEFADIRDFFPA